MPTAPPISTESSGNAPEQSQALVDPVVLAAARMQRTSSGRKVRSTARDQLLTPAQQYRLAVICATPGPEDRINKFLTECGLQPVSVNTQHKIWHRYNKAAEEMGMDIQKLRMLREMAREEGVPLAKLLGDHGLVAVQEIMAAARAGNAEDGAKLIMQGVSRLTAAERTELSRDKLDIENGKLQLQRDKFEFNASKLALACLPELRAIANDPSLDNDAKLLAVRKRLFGSTPN